MQGESGIYSKMKCGVRYYFMGKALPENFEGSGNEGEKME